MGAGKTTLGKAFAHAVGMQFVDLDWYIEQRFCKSISQLFSQRGEEAFRKIEQNMLHEVAQFEDVVISTGGGTPCFFDNMDYMNEHGQTVFLDVDTEVLFKRLRIAKQQRPILQGKDDEELKNFIQQALVARLPHYRKATYCFDGNRLESRRQIDESVAQLKKILSI